MPVLHCTHCWPFKKYNYISLYVVIISVQLKAEIGDVAGFVVTLVQILFHQKKVAIDT